MFINKIKLKEQVKSGNVDFSLLATCALFDHFQDSYALQTIAKHLQLKELAPGEQLFQEERDQKQIYIILFGEMSNNLRCGDSFQYKFQELRAIQQTDLLYLNKKIYDYLLSDLNSKAVRQISDLLSLIPNFKKLSGSHMQKFAQECRLQRINENRTIIEEGVIPKDAFVISKGTLKYFRKVKGRNVEFKSIGKREPILLYECLNLRPAEYSIITSSSCYVLLIERRTLLESEHYLNNVEKIQLDLQSIKEKALKEQQWCLFKKRLRIQSLHRN